MPTPIIQFRNIKFNESTRDYYQIDSYGIITRLLGNKSKLIEPRYVQLPLGSDPKYTYVCLSVFKPRDDNRFNNINYFRIDELICWFYKFQDVQRVMRIDERTKRELFTITHLNGNSLDNSIANLRPDIFIERWKDLLFEDIMPRRYRISNTGNMFNLYTNNKINGDINSGYYRVSLKNKDGNRRILKLHRLVAQTFKPNPNYQSLQVNHIDGNGINNIEDNLEWVDAKGNNEHAWVTGLNSNFSDNVSKYKHDIVEKACELLVEFNGSVDKTQKAMAELGIKVGDSFLRHLKFKRIHKDISDKYFDYETFPSTWNSVCDTNIDINLANHISLLIAQMCGDVGKVKEILQDEGFMNITSNNIRDIKFKKNFAYISDKYFNITGGKVIPV